MIVKSMGKVDFVEMIMLVVVLIPKTRKTVEYILKSEVKLKEN